MKKEKIDINSIRSFMEEVAALAGEQIEIDDLQNYYADVKFEDWESNPLGVVEQLEYLVDGAELKEENQPLIEEIQMLAKMKPQYRISNLMLRAKINSVEVPEFMEHERWEEDNGSVELRFIIANASDNELHDKQLEWLQEVTGVHTMFLEGNDYITLWN